MSVSSLSEKTLALQTSLDGSTTTGEVSLKKETTYDFEDPTIQAEVRRAIRKVDWTVLPVMAMFYFLSFLDRANIGNARVAGLQHDLKLTDYQYSLCVTITYIPYIASELPSNLLLRKIGPNIAMPAILTIWGVIVTLEGLVSSFTGLAIARAFLGFLEGPMFPGIVLYLSGFYTREELSLRVAFFFSTASLSGAFSGLLATAISKMGGVGGKPAWAWIFILEGLFTFFVGIASFWFVPKTPRHSKFLTERQKDLVMKRLEYNRPFTNPLDSFKAKYVWQSFKSLHLLIMCIVYFMCGTNLYGLALFLPSIIKQLGHSANRSQLLSVGPYAVGFLFTIFASWVSDRLKNRVLPMCGSLLVALIGYGMFYGSEERSIQYAALFLMVPGIYAITPIVSAWISNNSEPHYTRATSIALGFVSANSGGIFSTWLYPTKEGPRFRKTTAMNIAFTLGMIFLGLVNAAYLHFQNKRKIRNRAETLRPYVTSSDPDGGLEAWVELGDRHPDFKYIL